MTETTLDLWTIYFNPLDYPGQFVARKSRVMKGAVMHTDEIFVADHLEEVRELLASGLYCLHRHPDDDAAIVEVWV